MQEPATTPSTAPTGADQLTPAPPSNRAALGIVFLVVFIDLLGFGIVLPLLPLYATKLLEPLFPGSTQQAEMFRGLLLGLLMSSFSAMQFLFAPIWEIGRASCRERV